MRNFMTLIHPDAGQEARLAASIDLVRAYRGHLTCVQVTPFSYFLGGDPFLGYATAPLTLDAETERQAEIRAAVEARLTREQVPFGWEHFDGDPASCMVRAARLQDLIVLSIPIGHQQSFDPIPMAGDVAIHARSPVLAVPNGLKSLDVGGTAVVAWNGSSESAHALRFAMPMLHKASAVHIVTVGEDDGRAQPSEASAYLSRHGVSATLHEIAREGRPVGEALLAAASGVDGDYLVMGAYGHTRLREYVLGGVTRTVLVESQMPVLLAH